MTVIEAIVEQKLKEAISQLVAQKKEEYGQKGKMKKIIQKKRRVGNV